MLRNMSSFIGKIRELSTFSICLLGVDQLELSLEFPRLKESDGVPKRFFHLDKVSKTLRLGNFCELLDVRIRIRDVSNDNF